MARALAALIPGARVEVIERLRHMGLYEEPATFLDLMEPFFAKNAG